jgi:DNA-binding transcriptional ArsR family regulator
VVDPKIVAAFAEPRRLTILVACEQRPRALHEMADELKISRGSARHHVAVLLRAGLLHDGPRGYSANPGWSRVLAKLESIARQHVLSA